MKLVAATVVLMGLGALLIAGVAVRYGRIPRPAARDRYDMAQPAGSMRWVAREKEPWRFWPSVALFGAFGIGGVATGVWMWRERPAGHRSLEGSNPVSPRAAPGDRDSTTRFEDAVANPER